MGKYITTKEIKASAKIKWFIYASDFLFILVYMVFTYMLQSRVSKTLQIPFWIFSIISAILLTLPSPYNAKRRIYQSIILYLKKDYQVYSPVTGKDEKVEDIKRVNN